MSPMQKPRQIIHWQIDERKRRISIGRALFCRRFVEQNFNHQQRRADHDRAIRQVEHRPLVLLHVKQ